MTSASITQKKSGSYSVPLLIDKLSPSEQDTLDGKKALLAQRKIANIENCIRQIEKRTARIEAMIK